MIRFLRPRDMAVSDYVVAHLSLLWGHTNHAHAIDSWKGNDHFVKSRDSLGVSRDVERKE